MDFESRIKKEMTEGIVRAILEDAQYRVIESGVEKVWREVAHMSAEDYAKLAFPDAMRRMPDLTVMDATQTEKYLVEVKYRGKWDKSLFDEIVDQVQLFQDMVLVSVNADPPNQYKRYYPSTYLRCCRVRLEKDKIRVQMRRKLSAPQDPVKAKDEPRTEYQHYWLDMDKLHDGDSLWWAMSPLEEVFPLLQTKSLDDNRTLEKAIKALEGILTLPA